MPLNISRVTWPKGAEITVDTPVSIAKARTCGGEAVKNKMDLVYVVFEPPSTFKQLVQIFFCDTPWIHKGEKAGVPMVDCFCFY